MRRLFRFTLFTVAICLSAVTVSFLHVACGDSTVSKNTKEFETRRARATPPPVSPNGDVVYERTTMRNASNAVLSRSETGNLTPELWQRSARPWTHLGPDDEFIYNEDVGARSVDGGERHHYVIRRRPIEHPLSRPGMSQSTEIAAELSLRAATEPTGVSEVAVKVRGFPDWDVPLRLPPLEFSAGERQAARQARDSAIAARKAKFDQMSASLRQEIKARGGTVQAAAGWYTGWVTATIPNSAIPALSSRSDVRQIAPNPFQPHADGCDSSCTLVEANDWKVGDGRADTRLDMNQFLDAGHHGNDDGNGNPLLVGVVETYRFEDDAPIWDDWGAGSSRIHQRYRCDNADDSCSATSNFADCDCKTGSSCCGDHGTMVAAIILAHHEQNQTDNESYGDSCFSSGDGTNHCSAWTEASSGFAYEAEMVFIGNTASNAKRESAYATAAAEDVDVLNLSHNSDNACDPTSHFQHEDALENAYDDGIFVAAMAGNNSGPSASQCNLVSPADTPKAFAVNGLDATDGSCFGDYDSCDIHANDSALGGGDLVVNGNTMTGALSGIDLAAPTHVYYETQPDTGIGIVDEDNEVGGTSSATPHVTAAATLVKDWQLAEGHSWIGNPGRLHTMMLAMGDRHDGSGSPQTSRADDLYGLGRLKLRLLDSGEGYSPYGYRMRTYTSTSSETNSFFANWSNPLPNGTEMLKCVVHEGQDMTGESEVSDVYLRVTLRSPVSGTCQSSGGVIATFVDNSFDLKHMVAVDDDSTNLEGVCPEVDLIVTHVEQLSVTYSTLCYYAGVEDDTPN